MADAGHAISSSGETSGDVAGPHGGMAIEAFIRLSPSEQRGAFSPLFLLVLTRSARRRGPRPRGSARRGRAGPALVKGATSLARVRDARFDPGRVKKRSLFYPGAAARRGSADPSRCVGATGSVSATPAGSES